MHECRNISDTKFKKHPDFVKIIPRRGIDD